MSSDEDPETRARRLRRRAIDLDTRPAMLDMARALRRRLPGDDAFGDPLSTAGERPLHVVGRSVSALDAERPSAVRELGLGALQVWQSLSEASGRGRGDRPVALLFTDLVGFSTWALQAGDEDAITLLRAVGHVVEGAVADHRGTIVKRLGDGVMAAFDDASHAVAAALDAHDGLEVVDVGGHRPFMRAGVHEGRPRSLGGDYLGVDVNIAARVGEAAGPGELLVSDAACAGLTDVELGRPKRLRAAGVPKELRVRSVSRQP